MFLQGNCLEQQSMLRFIEILGFIGGGLTVVMLAMRTMIPLRVVGIASNIFQIAFGALAGVTPMLIQHGVLLPVNTYRLFEQMRLVKQVREASAVDLSMDWLDAPNLRIDLLACLPHSVFERRTASSGSGICSGCSSHLTLAR
jgi:hypothetical protein